MAKDNQMTFREWLNEINSANSDISLTVTGIPLSFNSLTKKELKAISFRNVYIRLLNIALSLFEWELPDTLDERVIELGYILRGSVCLFKGKEGTFCLPCTPNNMYNIYGNPTQARVMGFNGYQETVNVVYRTDIPHRESETFLELATGTGIYSRDNKLAYPYISYIREYATKISDKIIALNIATQRLKCPFYYVVNDNELKDTVQRLVEKIESNDDVIIRIKNTNSMKEIDSSIKLEPNQMKPEIVQAIKDAILFDFNMFLEIMGINTNPSPDKSQVVLTPELESNNSLIDLEQDIRFKNRKKLCEDAKVIFGIDISVKRNVEEVNRLVNQFKSEVQDNERPKNVSE